MGRPREFDIEKALDTASELFCEGLRGDIAFRFNGSDRNHAAELLFRLQEQRALLRQVVDRYQCVHFGFFAEALNQTTPLAVAERMLYGLADAFTTKLHPPGCLAPNCSCPVPAIRRTLSGMTWPNEGRRSGSSAQAI